MSLLAVATGKRLLLINPKVGDKMLTRKMDDILEEKPKTNDVMGMLNFPFIDHICNCSFHDFPHICIILN